VGFIYENYYKETGNEKTNESYVFVLKVFEYQLL